MRKVLAVDIDDVLAGSTDVIRKIANNKTGHNLSMDHYKVSGPYWGYYEHVMISNGIKSKATHQEVMDEWTQTHHISEPITGATEALKALSTRYKIILITARDPKIREDTEEWLQKHFSGMYDDLHVIGNFKVVDKPKTKGEICKQIGASWLIDDNPEHCMTAMAHGIDTILFGEYGWHFDAPEHLERCRNWQEVLEYFDGR